MSKNLSANYCQGSKERLQRKKLVKVNKVLIKYMEIFKKVGNIIKNEFNSELKYSRKYIKVYKS